MNHINCSENLAVKSNQQSASNNLNGESRAASLMTMKGTLKEKKKEALARATRRAVIKVCPPSSTRCHRSNTVGMNKATSAPDDKKSPLTV